MGFGCCTGVELLNNELQFEVTVRAICLECIIVVFVKFAL